MKIFTFYNKTFSILIDDLKYPFENEGRHILCEDVSIFHPDPNTRTIYLKKGYSFMDINDVIDELKKFNDSGIRWRCEERRKSLLDYYNKIFMIMKTYRREEQINKVINGSECTLHLAC